MGIFKQHCELLSGMEWGLMKSSKREWMNGWGDQWYKGVPDFIHCCRILYYTNIGNNTNTATATLSRPQPLPSQLPSHIREGRMPPNTLPPPHLCSCSCRGLYVHIVKSSQRWECSVGFRPQQSFRCRGLPPSLLLPPPSPRPRSSAPEAGSKAAARRQNIWLVTFTSFMLY